MITVVNLHKELYDVYIGRAGRGYDGKWGNPFRDGTREENIAMYEKHLLKSPELMQALPELLNKRLGCFCKPKACHGDVLKKYAELAEKEWLQKLETDARNSGFY
tara:strand:- start:215 stop:529 length:315 start_codon:yes stop_codon:yes gene_type:complete